MPHSLSPGKPLVTLLFSTPPAVTHPGASFPAVSFLLGTLLRKAQSILVCGDPDSRSSPRDREEQWSRTGIFQAILYHKWVTRGKKGPEVCLWWAEVEFLLSCLTHFSGGQCVFIPCDMYDTLPSLIHGTTLPTQFSYLFHLKRTQCSLLSVFPLEDQLPAVGQRWLLIN